MYAPEAEPPRRRGPRRRGRATRAWRRRPRPVAWLERLTDLQRDAKTVAAYARGLEDWLAFLATDGRALADATEDTGARFVGALRARPRARGLRLDGGAGLGGAGLSLATLRLRLTAVRRFYEYLRRRAPRPRRGRAVRPLARAAPPALDPDQ